MSVTDPEYDGEIVTLGIRIFEGVADDLPRWQPWIAGETAHCVASLYRHGANHVRPTTVTSGSTRGVWEIILRDGRYAVVPWGAGRDAETDLGTDRAVALAHLEERLAALTATEARGQNEISSFVFHTHDFFGIVWVFCNSCCKYALKIKWRGQMELGL